MCWAACMQVQRHGSLPAYPRAVNRELPNYIGGGMGVSKTSLPTSL